MREIKQIEVKKVADKIAEWLLEDKQSQRDISVLIANDPEFKDPVVQQFVSYLNWCCVGQFEIYSSDPTSEKKEESHYVFQKIFIKDLKANFIKIDKITPKISEAPESPQIMDSSYEAVIPKVEEAVSQINNDGLEEKIKSGRIYSTRKFEIFDIKIDRISKIYNNPYQQLASRARYIYGDEKNILEEFILNYGDEFVEFVRMFLWEMLDALPKAQDILTEKLRLEKEQDKVITEEAQPELQKPDLPQSLKYETSTSKIVDSPHYTLAQIVSKINNPLNSIYSYFQNTSKETINLVNISKYSNLPKNQRSKAFDGKEAKISSIINENNNDSKSVESNENTKINDDVFKVDASDRSFSNSNTKNINHVLILSKYASHFTLKGNTKNKSSESAYNIITQLSTNNTTLNSQDNRSQGDMTPTEYYREIASEIFYKNRIMKREPSIHNEPY